MVQRVEQSGYRFEYAQRKRHQRLRLQAGGKNQRNLRRLICSTRIRFSDNDCRPPATEIQPKLDFSCGALGRGAAGTWNSFLSAPGGFAAQRIVSRSVHAFHRGAADLFCGCDRGITKWHTVVNSAGAQLSFAASAQCYTSGLFGALFLPSIIGGDVARLAVGISRSPRPAAVVTGNVADRFLDVAAQLTLVSLGLTLLPGSLPAPLQAPARRVLIAGLLAAVVLFSMVLILSRPLLRGRSIRFRRRLAQLRHAIRSVSRRPHRL